MVSLWLVIPMANILPLFFLAFDETSYWLIINGKSGFLGDLYRETFILEFVKSSEEFSYYFLIALILLFFLKSLNFKFYYIFNIFKKIILLFKNRSGYENIKVNTETEKNFETEINQVDVQENFSFEKKNWTSS